MWAVAILPSTTFCHWKVVCRQTFSRHFQRCNEHVKFNCFDSSKFVKNLKLFVPLCTLSHRFTNHAKPSSLHCLILEPYHQTFAFATIVEHNSCTNHYTTRLIVNNMPILIHINGNNKSVSNNQKLSVAEYKNQTFKLLWKGLVYLTCLPR